MSAPFVVPQPDDMPDALDVTDPDSAVNRLWRMYNERRIMSAYPATARIFDNKQFYDFPCFRYRGGSQSSGNVPLVFDVGSVATIEEAVIDAGADVQTITFWNGILSSIYDLAANYFALVSEVEDGIDGQDYSNRWGPTLYGQAAFLFADAGITGVERRNGEDIETISGYGTLYQPGDIIGPWVFRDVATLLSLLKYRFIFPSHLNGIEKDARRVNIDTSFSLLQSDLVDKWVSQSAGGVARTMSEFDTTAFVYSIFSQLNFTSANFSGNRYLGATGKEYYAPGIVPRTNTGSISYTFGVYGVADQNYTGAGFSIPNSYNDAGQFAGKPEGGAILLKQGIPPPPRATTPQYLDISQYNDVDDGLIPFRDVHALTDVGYDVSVGMRVAKPFLISTVTGYEFEGVI